MSVVFSIEGMIRGYHVYQHIWTSQKREDNNVHDSFAASVNKEDDVGEFFAIGA